MPKVNRQPNKKARVRPEDVRCSKRSAAQGPIDWSQWWPFQRATGNAFKQLNKRQAASRLEVEEALL